MNRLASAALASAFFAATGGVALAANAPGGTASNSPANAPTASLKSTAASAAAMPNGARGADTSPSTVRITHALNLLEAQGYGDFRDFRRDGKNFDATVTRDGKQMSVRIDPDIDQVTVQG
jgi:cytochrome c5